jgi:hypothetical protein
MIPGLAFIVLKISKDLLTPISPGNHMIKGAGELNPTDNSYLVKPDPMYKTKTLPGTDFRMNQGGRLIFKLLRSRLCRKIPRIPIVAGYPST